MLEIPFSQACERNKYPILDTIRPYLLNKKMLLEIGSGTGQHALYFTQNLPELYWQSSDQEQYLPGLNAQIHNAKQNAPTDLNNLLLPIKLDVMQSVWLSESISDLRYDAVYSANTLHIMAWPQVLAMFSGLKSVITEGGLLIIYGPFKYQGRYTSASNQAFDDDLKNRGVGSGLRDFEKVDKLAKEIGFDLVDDVAMPANNQCLIWQHKY